MKAVIIVFLGENESIFCESIKEYNEVMKKYGENAHAFLGIMNDAGKLVYNSLNLEDLE